MNTKMFKTKEGFAVPSYVGSVLITDPLIGKDSSNNLYVRHREYPSHIAKYNNSGTLINVYNCTYSYSGEMKPNPVSVVVSSNGTIYVVGDGSTANSVISISSNGAIDVVVSTSGRASNFYPASNSFMGFIGIIQGMAIDSADNLYLSDSFNHSIIKIEAGGGPLTLLAGGARLGTNNAPLIGSVDGQGEAARFNKPMGITIDSTGNLFVVNSGNGSIRKITPTGNVTTIATGYNIPQGIAIDSSGNLYITDTQDAIVSKLSYPTYTKTLMPISVPGWKPSTITIDSLGFFYITDSNTGNVFKFSKGCLAGSYLNGNSCELCAIGTWSAAGATSCTACPAGTTTAATGSTSSNQCTEISHSFSTSSYSNKMILANRTDSEIVIDSSGNIYGFNSDKKITKTTPGPTPVTTIYSDYIFTSVRAMAFDSSQNLYVSGGNIIYKITGGIVSVYTNNSSTYGYVNGAITDARFNMIFGMVFDTAGNLYVADTNNYCIRKIAANTRNVTTYAGFGTNITSGVITPEIGRRDGSLADARFMGFRGIVIDSAGNLYVAHNAHWNEMCVIKISTSGQVTTISRDYLFLSGITIDSSDNLYVLDSGKMYEEGNVPTLTNQLTVYKISYNSSTSQYDKTSLFTFTKTGIFISSLQRDILGNFYLTFYYRRTTPLKIEIHKFTPPGEPCPDNASCANGRESFVCSNDYKKNSTGDGCEPCPTGTSGLNCTTVSPGYQMVNGILKTCATYGTCPGGTGSNVPMVCSNGYYNNGEFYCIPCARGSYGSNGICLPCSDIPATNSTATWTTIDVAQTSCTIPLTCNPNYKLNELSNTCINCPKGSIGSNCTTIVPGYYVNNGIVQRCPSGSTCPGGSIDDIKTTTITCMDGWENTNSGCSRCPVGSYGTGGTCSNCSSFPATDSTATWTNNGQSLRSCDLAETCKTNFYLNNISRQCDPCPSNATCEGGTASFVCGTNYTKNETDDGCISLCPSNATCTGGSSSFVCNDGYMMNEAGNGCVKCPDGTEGLNCITTLGGYYKSGSTTLKCPSNASCPGGSESFVCSNGFIKNSTGDECVRCPDGTEGLNCTTILAGYYNNGTATLFCPSNASCAGGSASFVCADGYMMNESGDGCVKCPEGTEGQNCTTTLGGYYRSGSNSFLCPSNASCVGGLTSFVCSNNYIKNSTSNGCDPCPAGSEGLNCTTILRGYYNNGTTTLLCPSNATCAGGSASFVCDDGYMMNESGDGCVKCPDGTSGLNCTVALPGYYKNGANILKCPSNASCPGGSASFTCSNGYYVNTRTGTCDKVTLIVESRNTQLNNTAGTPTIADATSCTAAGCTLLFKDPTTGNMNPKNPCISEGNYYDFTTQKCINKCCAISMSNAKNDANCKYDVALGPLIKNTALCATKPSPCCINSSQANNTSCKNYWSRGADSWTAQHNTKCAAGFTDYGIDSISEKRRKYRQLHKLGTWL